ncbi:MAG: LamG-like jellyroll fold domain-containing protein [Candidatus Latescibacterota bacterium]|nr:LamG-like jellyroll fold domain-containing protein [Candidatus Latescibacterota bacterium]
MNPARNRPAVLQATSLGSYELSASGENGLTVEAWVHLPRIRAEASQVAAAQWEFAKTMTGHFATYDAGDTDGLETKGFFGAVYARGWIYFSPQCNNEGRHGQALRYRTAGAFDNSDSWQSHDAENTSGLNTRGYYGAICDGRYVYYVPRTDGERMHSRVLRYDTDGEFNDEVSWTAYDAGLAKSYQGGAFDGRFVYFAPGYDQDTGSSGVVLRYDAHGEFDDPASWQTTDVAGTSGQPSVNFDGALFDGQHVYFAPLESGGNVTRYDVRGDFGSPASWESFPANQAGQPSMDTCVGAVFDGRWVYFVPYAHSVVARYDTSAPFADPGSWESWDVAGTDGLDARGFDGAAFDGRFIYLIPFWEGEDAGKGFHARLVRHDTTKPFAATGSWQVADGCAEAPPNPGGFNGGAFDGRFLYMVPWREDDPEGEIRAHGHVLRFDSAGAGARFQLKAMDCGHNGGLGGSVPGPAWIVNTTKGAISVQAHTIPEPGWHHLVGTYDGGRAALFIDGELAAQAEGAGELTSSSVPVTVGYLPEGASALQGQIGHVHISAEVRTAEWIRTAWQNLRDSPGFARIT